MDLEIYYEEKVGQIHFYKDGKIYKHPDFFIFSKFLIEIMMKIQMIIRSLVFSMV